MVVAADDVGDAHVVVVHHHGVQVGGRAVAAQDDHVVQFGVADAHFALHQIVHHRFALARGAQADDEGGAGGCLGGVAVAPGAVDAQAAALGLGLFAQEVQFGRGQEAAIAVAGGEHLLRDLGMAGLPGGLEDGGLVGFQAQPGQPVQDHVGCRRGAAFAVGILDAQQESAAVVPGKKIVEQRSTRPPDMQQAGRRRSKTSTNDHHGFRLSSGVQGSTDPWRVQGSALALLSSYQHMADVA